MKHTHRGPMTGRTVLVTGATAGIGKATALGLSAMGAHLAITGRDLSRTEAAARDIRAAGGGQVDVFVADLSAQAVSSARARPAVEVRLPPGQDRSVLDDCPVCRLQGRRRNVPDRNHGGLPAPRPARRSARNPIARGMLDDLDSELSAVGRRTTI